MATPCISTDVMQHLVQRVCYHSDMIYLVPKCRTRAEYRASNSRFIATLERVSSTEEARAFIQSIRDEMPDATHHVYAFKVGYGSSVSEGMSDDGEPNGTSGPPVLAVLRGADIGDAAIVVTRYFGGTKLGTGGLVSAYKGAAKAVINAATMEPKVDWATMRLVVPYNLSQPLRGIVERFNGIVENEEFSAEITWTLKVPEENVATFCLQVKDATAGKIVPESCSSK